MGHTFDRYQASYESVVEDSVAFSGLDHAFFLRAKAIHLSEIFAGHFGIAAPRLLDVGCGVGRLHPLLRPIVSELAGSDISEPSLERARRDNPDVEYRRMPEVGRMPWPDESFDAALAVCVFHHVLPGNRAALAGEMRRVIRPGGLVVIIEHNPINPATRLAVLRCPFDEDAILLGARNARALLRSRDLVNVESRHFLALPWERPWASTIERRLRRVPVGAQYSAFGTRR